jgi:hypothetical protein
MGIKDIIKPIGSQSFVVGIGVAALFYFLGPQMKQTLRPIAVKGAQGVMVLGNKTVKAFGESKDKLSSMLSEKANEAVEKGGSPEAVMNLSENLVKELKEERETSNKILADLITSISGLKDELAQLRNNGNFQQV